ncbi:MAG: gamma carbonic anhydrase family protein, partial [Thermoplasmata archaeon]|nr:gamma carbonic anhydrase family protein [Thermoplasmata archaeon]
GMKAVVLNRAVVGSGSVVAAGALVKEGSVIPPGSLVVGVPGMTVRESDASLEEYARKNAATYVDLALRHKGGEFSEYRQ